MMSLSKGSSTTALTLRRSRYLPHYLKKSLSTVSNGWNPGISFANLTDVGMRRANNQDSYACLHADSEARFHQRGHLFVVADGMGAHAAGELASKMATERIAMQYFRSDDEDPVDALRKAVIEANSEIHRRGQQNPEFHNMGTTASALAILPEGAVIAHVGDSRVYRLRSGTFEQLTFDHSLVWEMQASGQVHPDSVLGKSIPKNVITRSLGPNAEVAVDVEGPHAIRKGDVFLLCSDGLTGEVDDTEIAVLVDCLPETKAARVLVDLANLRGGPDNSTVVIVRVTDDLSSQPQARAAKSATASPVSPVLVGTSVVCFLVSIGLFAASLYEANTLGMAVVSGVLGMIAGAVALIQFMTSPSSVDSPKRSGFSGGKGPYRRYSGAATLQLCERLGATVDALRDAAAQQSWEICWDEIDQHQARAREALGQSDPKAAVSHQAEAILETMQQLRDQKAGETLTEDDDEDDETIDL
ncbi:MAG: PP2C family serine/threonine-protein phosphatase [Planctomycetota bacterium]